MNSEEYKCYAFDVGAGALESAQNKNKYNANVVGVAISRPQKYKYYERGITLIALIITIIIMLILAGVVLNLTLGEHGIFKTTEMAAKNYINAQNKEIEDLNNVDSNITNVIDEINSNMTTEKRTKYLFKANETSNDLFTFSGISTNYKIDSGNIVFITQNVGAANVFFKEVIDTKKFKTIKIFKQAEYLGSCQRFDIILREKYGDNNIATISINNNSNEDIIDIKEFANKYDEIYLGIQITAIAGDVRAYHISGVELLP